MEGINKSFTHTSFGSTSEDAFIKVSIITDNLAAKRQYNKELEGIESKFKEDFESWLRQRKSEVLNRHANYTIQVN